MGRKIKGGTLPVGRDEVVPVHRVRPGMWVVDPVTGEWVNVKQAARFNVCAGFGGQQTWLVSMRKVGERELGADELVTVRVPDPAG